MCDIFDESCDDQLIEETQVAAALMILNRSSAAHEDLFSQTFKVSNVQLRKYKHSQSLGSKSILILGLGSQMLKQYFENR